MKILYLSNSAWENIFLLGEIQVDCLFFPWVQETRKRNWSICSRTARFQQKHLNQSLLSPWSSHVPSLFPSFHWGKYDQCGIDWLYTSQEHKLPTLIFFLLKYKTKEAKTTRQKHWKVRWMWRLPLNIAQQVNELRFSPQLSSLSVLDTISHKKIENKSRCGSFFFTGQNHFNVSHSGFNQSFI